MSASADALVRSMADAWNRGRPDEIIALAGAAKMDAAHSEDAQALLGAALQQVGRHAEAADIFARLAEAHPETSAYWNNLGVARRQTGDFTGSAGALERARRLAPRDADVHYNLGLLHLQQQRWAAARETLLEAVRLAPQFVEARLEAAHSCHVCGDIEGEEAMLQGVEAWPPQPAEQALVLASILSVLGRIEVALDVLARAVVVEGRAAPALRLRIAAQRVALYERHNRIEEARLALREIPLTALDALEAGAADARLDVWRALAAMALREGRPAEAADLYRKVLAQTDTPDEVRAGAAFGLAAALDRLARHDEAWDALALAHEAQMRVVRQAAPRLAEPGAQPLPMAARAVDAAARAKWKPLPAPDARHSPVFVIGFPRSGTTLLEQMLDAHPDFASMDERGYVYQLIERMEGAGQRYPADLARLTQADADQLREVYWQLVAHTLPGLGSRRLVDKNPLNMLCLPMILRLFPEARIVLCVRHPCDVLLSCTMQAFRSPTFMAMCATLPRLARGYADAFAQCCAHMELFGPAVREWRYEAAVEDLEGEAARLAQFLGVADPSPMLGFAEHARSKPFISTPSYAQVTRPVSRASVGRWLRYRAHFEPVLPVLRPWLERFGYAA